MQGDDVLAARLAVTRAQIARQRRTLDELRQSSRDLRRQHIEALAEASAVVDRTSIVLLRRQGVPVHEPLIPSYPPDDLR